MVFSMKRKRKLWKLHRSENCSGTPSVVAGILILSPVLTLQLVLVVVVFRVGSKIKVKVEDKLHEKSCNILEILLIPNGKENGVRSKNED